MHAYGWTLEYTLEKPRHILLKLHFQILKREHESYRMAAALKGIAVEPFETRLKIPAEVDPIKPEREKMVGIELDRLFEEKEREISGTSSL